jgi:hypothetical protein
MPSVHADLHDPSSPVAELRRESLDAIIELTARGFVATGQAQPARTTIDIFLNAVEYTCYRLYLDTDGSEEAVAEARRMMMRIAVAVLGRPVARLTSPA